MSSPSQQSESSSSTDEQAVEKATVNPDKLAECPDANLALLVYSHGNDCFCIDVSSHHSLEEFDIGVYDIAKGDSGEIDDLRLPRGYWVVFYNAQYVPAHDSDQWVLVRGDFIATRLATLEEIKKVFKGLELELFYEVNLRAEVPF
jgi:hypothetical protein